MAFKTFCKSCRVPTRQLRVQSSSFQDIEASYLAERFHQWDGIIYVCKKQEHDYAYIHFESDDLASLRYYSRNNATLDGEEVRILPVYNDEEPVHYTRPPISFLPLPHY